MRLYAGPRFYQSKLNDMLRAGAKFGTNNILFMTLTADSSEDFRAGLDNSTSCCKLVFEHHKKRAAGVIYSIRCCPQR